MSVVAATHPWLEIEPYRVTVDEYRFFRKNGYLVAKGVVRPEHVDELSRHCDDLLSGRIDVSEFVHQAPGRPIGEVLHRIHMGHLKLELWERYLLYPRLLDIVEVLVGPDVAAMQTMLFTKAPGANGQGFHQDSYYIPVFPDSLIGAWIAIDKADVENGCLWMSAGSNAEPIYPPAAGYGYGDYAIEGISYVSNVGGHSNEDDDPLNTLKPIAERYRAVEVPVEIEPGDVAFFGGHLFHRSLKNRSATRYRRSFVNHYCNARSYTTWNGGNQNQILARGNTHLEFALPRFGTPCAALNPDRCSQSDTGVAPAMMMATPDGDMAAQVPSGDDHED